MIRQTPPDSKRGSSMPTGEPMLQSVCPFFVVRSLRESLDFYCEKPGFRTEVLVPDEDPFFAIVRRDHVAFCLKEIASDVLPIPNYTRHKWARWDAFSNTSNPDALYAEYCKRGVKIHEPLADIDDGLRAFEIRDVNQYVICFGRESEPTG